MTKAGTRLDFVVPPRVARRQKRRVAPPRLGLLRLAPRLSVLAGDRREVDWPAIAGRIGAAMTDGLDPRGHPVVRLTLRGV